MICLTLGGIMSDIGMMSTFWWTINATMYPCGGTRSCNIIISVISNGTWSTFSQKVDDVSVRRCWRWNKMTSLTPDAKTVFGGGANEPLALTYYGSGLIGKVILLWCYGRVSRPLHTTHNKSLNITLLFSS